MAKANCHRFPYALKKVDTLWPLNRQLLREWLVAFNQDIRAILKFHETMTILQQERLKEEDAKCAKEEAALVVERECKRKTTIIQELA